jgi:hypothetical protein
MRIHALSSLSAAILVYACAAPTRHPVATSGSKSDATVMLTAKFSPNGEAPRWGGSQSTADDRCGAWGIPGSEPLGSKISELHGCQQLRVHALSRDHDIPMHGRH